MFHNVKIDVILKNLIWQEMCAPFSHIEAYQVYAAILISLVFGSGILFWVVFASSPFVLFWNISLLWVMNRLSLSHTRQVHMCSDPSQQICQWLMVDLVLTCFTVWRFMSSWRIKEFKWNLCWKSPCHALRRIGYKVTSPIFVDPCALCWWCGWDHAVCLHFHSNFLIPILG